MIKGRANIRFLLPGYLLSLLLYYGCTRDAGENTDPSGPRTVKLNFVLDIPASTSLNADTRSGQTLAESFIGEAQVLIFAYGSYRYRVPASNVVNNAGIRATFSAELQITTAEITMYIIANGKDFIAANEPNLNETLFEYSTRLRGTVGSGGITGNLIMWGSHVFPTGISEAELNSTINVTMLRAVARVDIFTENTAADFTLSTVQAFRAANLMHVIPSFTPSIPNGTLYNVNTEPITAAGPNSVSQLYLPESASPPPANLISGSTCVVIGGYFRGSGTPSYYRLDFNPLPDNSLFGQILRNHRYAFNVESITAPGYATPQEAAANAAVIASNLVFWRDGIKYTVYDSNNYLGVSENQIGLAGDAGASFILDTETDFAAYTLHWADQSGVPDPGPGSASLSDADFSIVKSPEGSQITVTALTANPSGGPDRVRYIVISAGNLTLLVTITQRAE